MQNTYIVAGVIAAAGLAGWLVLGAGDTPAPAAEGDAPAPATQGDALVAVTQPDKLSHNAQMGRRAFEGICADCHGLSGVGRDGRGPPLIHRIYEPSHHGDEAFQLAVVRGVRSHHWGFGDMAPVPGLSRADVAMIVAYIREVQRANGIN